MASVDNVETDQCLVETLSDYLEYNTPEIAFVFFDLETGGLHINKDILQIAMISENLFFSTYVTPIREIDSSASKVNGLTKEGNQLFFAGNAVPSQSREIVSKKLIEYLQMLNKRCILIAHNCTFDSTRLITFLKECSALQEFTQVVHGFTDTLALFRKYYPKRQTGYKLSVLAHELMDLPCDGAHNAKVDIQLLEKLTINKLSTSDLIKYSISVQDVIQRMDLKALINENVTKLLPLEGIISKEMLERLAKHGIDYDTILNKYRKEGEDATVILLKAEEDHKPQCIKSDKVLEKILDHLRSFKITAEK